MIAPFLKGREALRGEAGLTVVELLVASAMGITLMGAVGSLVVGAMQSQPAISRKAADVQTARWVLERMTRELRNGIRVDRAEPMAVSFEAYVARQSCGESASPSGKCEVTYSCDSEACTRTETLPGVTQGGVATTIVNGLANPSTVFEYLPNPLAATYVRVTLGFPSPSGGSGKLTVSDGSSLRNATLDH